MRISQAIEIERKYFVKKIPGDRYTNEKAIIALPDEYKELKGYGLYVETHFLDYTKNSIIIGRGQEGSNNNSTYVIEKMEKIKGKRFPKYRMPKEKIQAMYDSVPHPGVEYERSLRAQIKHKSGRLLYVSQHFYFSGLMPWRDDKEEFGWVVEFDDEPNACYVLYYDWLTGIGKISNNNISIIHEYKLKDLSKVWEHAIELNKLLDDYEANKNDEAAKIIKELIGINM